MGSLLFSIRQIGSVYVRERSLHAIATLVEIFDIRAAGRVER